MSENTVAVTDTTFKADVLESKGPVLVDFWADWCGPCKMIAPALEEIAAEYKGRVTVAKVNKAELIETVKRVALVAERNTAVQMKFGDNQIILDAGSGDEAMATEAVEADINGDELTTGFNPQFLLDGLTAIDGEFVDLAFTQATKPVVISGTDADDASSFRYLLMPRRLLS